MRKNTERKRKFHKRYSIGILSLFLAVGLFFAILSIGEMQSHALSGVITGSSSDGDAFWNGISVPNDLLLSQNLTVSGQICSGVSYSEDYKKTSSGYYGDSHTKTFNISFPRGGVFSPSISVKTVISRMNSSQDLGTGQSNAWNDYVGTERYFSYLNYPSRNTVTYYKVYTGEGSSNMGDILLNYYKQNYTAPSGQKRSEKMMLTTEEQYGRVFSSLAENCATANGWSKYTSGTSIPLWQGDGQVVKRIEMITVNAVDFWFASYKTEGEGNTGYNSKDLDVMLYTPHTYVFNYTNSPIYEQLQPPVISTEGGKSIAGRDAISIDDLIVLSPGDNPEGTAQPQYYLSDKVVNMSGISWINYSEPFSPEGKKYLYVRNTFLNNSKHYIECEPSYYEIRYMENSGSIVNSSPVNGGSVDVGTKIELSQTGAYADAAMFYTYEAQSAPTLTRVSYDARHSIGLDNLSQDGKIAFQGDQVYIKINGIWYYCSDSTVKRYTQPIEVGEEIRVKGSMNLFVLVEDSGKEVGEFQKLGYSYAASEQTAAPEATVKTSATEPAVIKLGSSIGLMCNTTGSKIFYTTNGSAPVIKITAADGPIAVEETGTKLFTDAEPIVIDESIADYGDSVLIMAQAVTYSKIGDNYYCIYQDSPVARFHYIVEAQAPVEAIQSVPQTNAQTPAEVQVGNKIQLFSNTPGATILYTTDGSEPQYEIDTNGELAVKGTTKIYNGAEGVLVEKPKDSSLLTITAIGYKENLAVSGLSHLVFAYPGAVSAPYANPAEGSVTENTEVILKSATEGATIYYEVAYGDAKINEPTTASKVFDASNPIKITQKTSIKAFAVKDSIESTVSSFTYTVATKLKTPEPSIDTGAVISSGTVISLKADKGATIYYTLDGSDPRDPANKKVQVGSNVVINGDAGAMIVLRTYAAQSGYTNSEVGTYSYNISAYAGGIYADRESGEIVKNGEKIHLHTDMSDAEIYYTTDGSTPTTDSHSGDEVTIHGEPGEQITIMALAIADGSEKSTTFATFTYIIMDKLAAPTSSVPDGAIFVKESMVELKAESGRIYYTVDGSDPTTSSNLYKKSIVIEKAVTIKAIAVADDLEQSEISIFNYGFAEQVAAPIASYASGELEMGTKVTFTCATEGATIYYRTDGKDINLSRKNELEIYKEPIIINKATSFKVIAIKDKMQDSKILNVGYTVKEPVVITPVEEETQQNYGNQSNRLQSRRSFSDTESGPSYTDVVLRNASYGAIIAADEGVLPDTVQLKVESTNVTDAVNRRVQQVISESYGVVASYDVTLLVNGEEAQPEGTIEIGLPIPVEYENAMIHIVHVQEDGNIELHETRRSGGVAYAKVDHLSIYSIAAPVEFEEEKAEFPWLPVVYTLAVGLTGLGCFLIYKAKKDRKEEVMLDD